jgi:hypothetical protein
MVATPAHLAKYVRQDIPRLEHVARFRIVGDIPADTGDHIVILKGAQAEACPSSNDLRQRGRFPNGGFCSSGVGV